MVNELVNDTIAGDVAADDPRRGSTKDEMSDCETGSAGQPCSEKG